MFTIQPTIISNHFSIAMRENIPKQILEIELMSKSHVPDEHLIE